MQDNVIDAIITGADASLSTAAKAKIQQSVDQVQAQLTNAKTNRTAQTIFGSKSKSGGDSTNSRQNLTDTEVYTNLSEMINGNKDPAGFGTLLDSLAAKNKKYYSIIKDYEIMPILIPQINRVLMFLVNECLSPDIQNDTTFQIQYTATNDPNDIQSDLDEIKSKMKLDNMLREVYTNRYKLGNELYAVIDYNRTFEHMLEMVKSKKLNEASAGMSDIDYLDSQYNMLSDTLDECSCSLKLLCTDDNYGKPGSANTEEDKKTFIKENTVDLKFSDMNIHIERSAIAKYVEDAHAELLSEAYSGYKMDNLMSRMVMLGSLNEAVVDTSKMEELIQDMKKKKLQRCTIERFDPAKMFKLKIGGKVIGYLHIADINGNSSNIVNFAQSLKDQLLKSRATNLDQSTKTAEEIISKELSEQIINKFDPNIGINRVEDIDLLHDYIRNNEVYKGNKRITFYYEDEIFDMSRADGSLLTNAVFFTKLYATLMLNNIETKVLRGRGRQIHTVHMGASKSIQRYLENAMAALTMPENNLGTLHGSFEQILNPFNSASDIIIPTEDDTQKYIETDYIPGQDIDMNDDFLKMLLNSIVTSFGLDSAVIDATNGNLQFARTLSMESLQICNSIRNEQQDLHDPWSNMCLRILTIMGKDETKKAIENGLVKVSFYEPKSLILQNTIEDINNAKSFAESIADVIPEFNADGMEPLRSKFVYSVVRKRTNLDWGIVDDALKAVSVDIIDDNLKLEVRKIIQEYIDNTEERQFGDGNGDGLTDDEQDLIDSSDDDL